MAKCVYNPFQMNRQQQPPTTANNNRQQPRTTANNRQQPPTTANNRQLPTANRQPANRQPPTGQPPTSQPANRQRDDDDDYYYTKDEDGTMGVKGDHATATKGKSTQEGEHYQLGDLTRGVLTSMQEQRTQRKQLQDAAITMDDAFDPYSFSERSTSTTATTSTNDASNTTNGSNININNNYLNQQWMICENGWIQCGCGSRLVLSWKPD
jgi:hypothetical protein